MLLHPRLYGERERLWCSLRELPSPRVVVWAVWLALFGAAFLGYLLSMPLLEEALSQDPGKFFSHRVQVSEEILPSYGDFLRIWSSNFLLFLLIYGMAFWTPRLAFYFLLMLAVKTGVLLAPLDEITWNSLPYTLVIIPVGLVEFWAFAQGVLRRFALGVVGLGIGAALEVWLILRLLYGGGYGLG